jgi:hypothetical protein
MMDSAFDSPQALNLTGCSRSSSCKSLGQAGLTMATYVIAKAPADLTWMARRRMSGTSAVSHD